MKVKRWSSKGYQIPLLLAILKQLQMKVGDLGRLVTLRASPLLEGGVVALVGEMDETQESSSVLYHFITGMSM